MISAALLLAYGVTAGTWGAGSLMHARWARLAPRLAIAAWHAVAASVLLSLVAAGAALSISFQHVRGDLARLLDLCASNLKHGYASPGGTLVATIGVTAAALLTARTVWCGVRVACADRCERANRVAMLDVVARTDVLPGALVVEHDEPYAFCIGGKRHRVVVTSALLATLTPEELRAVLAHEEAHLQQRHHIALLVCRTLFGTLGPFFPVFRNAMPLVRLFAELSADDSARRHVGARPLRAALTTLACGPAPSGALAASANDVETRILRLAGPSDRLTTTRTALAGVAIGATFLVPLALAAAPALAMAWEGVCLIG